MVAFFTPVDGSLVPTAMSVSAWSPTNLAGTAVCGLLARELEIHGPAADFIPARFTVDLFRPVLNEPITLRGEVVRDGTRVRVVDAALVQRDEVRARASVMYLAVGEQPPGEVWQAGHDLPVPEYVLDSPYGEAPHFKSGDQGWTPDFGSGANNLRKAVWQNLPALVEGEPLTPFQRAAFVADCTNMVCNWGTAGVGFINSDVTLTLARLPIGHEVGLHAQDHISAAGVMVATATLYDRTGPLGATVITGLSNARRQVDLAAFAEGRSLPVTAN
ncbi:acyl-CoA thioesterase domain-containing protein [Nocardia yamanashiensis]|uniref:acyl-CoA thioesterase domain-containing protein n=1 Tax=Nocardia yamanashiensis TaxID=209247 RepID=UPI00082C0697|nr:acyl-CoA thioesterase domain-containing protein [Nocardia yamanashiensis]